MTTINVVRITGKFNGHSGVVKMFRDVTKVEREKDDLVIRQLVDGKATVTTLPQASVEEMVERTFDAPTPAEVWASMTPTERLHMITSNSHRGTNKPVQDALETLLPAQLDKLDPALRDFVASDSTNPNSAYAAARAGDEVIQSLLDRAASSKVDAKIGEFRQEANVYNRGY
jgi:hypothetical protein